MSLHIQPTLDPSQDDIEYLYRGIYEEARKKKGMRPNQSFGFFLKDDTGKTVGGINGFCYYGCLYIDQLYIDEAYQGQGWGQKLMEAAERFGVEQKCTMVTLTTMDWEARGFYEKLGYDIIFTISGYENDSRKYFLRKELS